MTIIVGIDGGQAALTAVRYAAAEALRTGEALELVHAAPDRCLGDRLLNRARRTVREITGDRWGIHTRIVAGPPARALSAAAHHARVVVIGHRHRSPLEHLLVGSVLARLAGRLTVPLVVVPESWVPSDPHGLVVLGVDEDDDAEALLRVALATARDRSARLGVVHAWDLPDQYDDLLTLPADGDVWPTAPLGSLDAALRRVRHEHPHVAVDLELTHGPAGDVLCRAAERADLLIVGIRHRALTAAGLGRTVHAVLHDAACPVALVPVRSAAAIRGTRPVLDPELV
ncbi:MAG TPA: universal stress protein [Nocardioides sp.]|nr:universal stress protein [Nocardioides sp.]